MDKVKIIKSLVNAGDMIMMVHIHHGHIQTNENAYVFMSLIQDLVWSLDASCFDPYTAETIDFAKSILFNGNKITEGGFKLSELSEMKRNPYDVSSVDFMTLFIRLHDSLWINE